MGGPGTFVQLIHCYAAASGSVLAHRKSSVNSVLAESLLGLIFIIWYRSETVCQPPHQVCGPVGIDTDHWQHRVLPCDKQEGGCRAHGCRPGEGGPGEERPCRWGGCPGAVVCWSHLGLAARAPHAHCPSPVFSDKGTGHLILAVTGVLTPQKSPSTENQPFSESRFTSIPLLRFTPCLGASEKMCY